MELRKLISDDVVATLQRHTDMMDQQTRLLEAIVPTLARIQAQDAKRPATADAVKPEEQWSLDFWRFRHMKSEACSDREPKDPMQTFGCIQQQLQPVIARAEELVLEALEHRDAQILALAESSRPVASVVSDHQESADPPASTCSLVENEFLVLCNSFQHRLSEIEKLEQRCRDVIRYLKSAQDRARQGGNVQGSHLVSAEL